MSTQLVLAYSRRGCAETSKQAFQSVSNAEKLRGQIYRLLLNVRPMTDDEIYTLLPMPKPSPSGARTRRAELVDSGQVRDTGLRHETKSGRWSVVWGAVKQ